MTFLSDSDSPVVPITSGICSTSADSHSFIVAAGALKSMHMSGFEDFRISVKSLVAPDISPTTL